MYKVMMLVALLAMIGEPSVESIRFVDKSVSGLPIKFQRQSVSWEYGVEIRGVVENRSANMFDFVTVTFTALGERGEFLGRTKVLTDPYNIPPNQKGQLKVWLDTDKVVPARIEFIVNGEKQ